MNEKKLALRVDQVTNQAEHARKVLIKRMAKMIALLSDEIVDYEALIDGTIEIESMSTALRNTCSVLHYADQYPWEPIGVIPSDSDNAR